MMKPLAPCKKRLEKQKQKAVNVQREAVNIGELKRNLACVSTILSTSWYLLSFKFRVMTGS